jgi:hypothetical protein
LSTDKPKLVSAPVLVSASVSRTTAASALSRSHVEHLLAAVVLALCLTLFYRDIVFGGRTFLQLGFAPGTMPISAGGGAYNYPGDPKDLNVPLADPGAIAWVGEPSQRLGTKLFATNDSALWNPHVGLGDVFLADGYSAPYEPLQILSSLAPERYWPLAVDMQVLVRFLIAGVFTYLFARRLGLQWVAAVLAGIAYMLTSYFVAYGNHPQLRADTLLPLALYSFDRLQSRISISNVLLSISTIAWLLIASFPESGFMSLVLASLWYICLSVWRFWKAGRAWKILIRSAIAFLGVNIAGLGLSAFLLLPLIDNIRTSLHIHEAGTGLEALPAAYAVLGLIPRVMPEIPWPSVAWAPHIYTTVLILAAFGVLAGWKLTGQRFALLFFSMYALIFCLKIYGFPLTQWIGLLPGFSQLQIYKYTVPSIGFSLAIVAALGVDALLRGHVPALKILIVFICIFALVFGIALANQPLHIDSDSMIRNSFFVLSITIFVCLLAQSLNRARLNNVRLIYLLMGMMVIEPTLWHSNIQRPVRYDPYTKPPFVTFLQQGTDYQRFFGFDRTLQPNIGTAYALDDVRFMSALVPKYRALYMAQFIMPDAVAPALMLEPGQYVSIEALERVGKTMSTPPEVRKPELADVPNRITQLQGIEYPLYLGKYIDLLNTSFFVTTNNIPLITSLNLLTLNDHSSGVQPPPFAGQLLTLNNELVYGITQQAPQKRAIPLLMPAGHTTLQSSIAGSGVGFEVKVTDSEGAHTIFSSYLDSHQSISERGWQPLKLDLSQWSGQRITITLESKRTPDAANTNSNAYWASPILTIQDTAPIWAQARLKQITNIALNDVLLDQNLAKQGPTFSTTMLKIGDQSLRSLFMHPPGFADLALQVPNSGAQLQFSVGMDPQVWQSSSIGDEATFRVIVLDVDTKTPVYQQTLNPQKNAGDRQWRPAQIDLSRWSGKSVTLRFETTGVSEHQTDGGWAHWGDIRLLGTGVGVANPQLARFERVYDSEVQIFRNNFAYPRAFIVYQIASAPDADSAARMMTRADFDPSTQAVVEGQVSSNSWQAPTTSGGDGDSGVAQIVERTANTMRITTTLDKPGLLVVSESYAPGWQAYVDGQPAPVVPTDVFLRGVYVDAGRHEVQLVYAPRSFTIGLAISITTLIMLIAGSTLVIIAKRRKQRRPSSDQPTTTA